MTDWFQWSQSGSWSAKIEWIYYGIPQYYLLDRSALSSNQPKNGQGDPRECAVSACGDASASAGDPIDTRSGNFDYSLSDLSLQTIAGPLTFQRSYASLATDMNIHPSDLSPGWSHNQDTRLIFEGNTVWFKAHTLNQYRFTNSGSQTYSPYPGVVASLVYHPGSSTYTLTASDQSAYSFNSAGQLQSWRNELGYGFDYSYSSGKLYRVSEPLSGRYLQFNYQNGRLSSVNDHSSRQVSFSYNANGDLTSFTDARNKTWTYAYDGSSHRMTVLRDPHNDPFLSNAYDAQGRVYEQFNGAGERIVRLTFNTDGSTTLLDALGRESVDGYDSRQTNTYRLDSAAYSIHKTYDDNFRPSAVTDQDGRSLEYEWSADGANLLYIQDAAGYETHLQYDAANHLTGVADALGSVRQLANAAGTIFYRQSFDPFGNLIASVGAGGSSYGYTGEWTDGSGLQYLRARYYAPQQGRFVTRDPFPGMLGLPATLNPYSYVVNNPIQMTDPSGEIAPILVAAGLGGLIGAGIDIGVQLYNMRPFSLGQALRCMNWGKVGISFASGAVAGLAGFITFSGITAIMGTGFLANVVAGAFSGVMAGQHGRATGLLLSGQTEQIISTLFRPQDMVLDAILGGVFGGIAYGIGKLNAGKPILNQKGESYPSVEIPEYGQVPFPEPPYTPNNSASRSQEFTRSFKLGFQNWWKNQGYAWPEGEIHIHHIKPLKYGGTNTYENLVPLTRLQHYLFTNWWRYFK